MKHLLTTGTSSRARHHPTRLVVVLRANDDGEITEEFVRFMQSEGKPPPMSREDDDAPLFTLRQHFVLNCIASAHGMTALELFGGCPPPSATFLNRLGDVYEAMAQGDHTRVQRCLQALEAATASALRCASG